MKLENVIERWTDERVFAWIKFLEEQSPDVPLKSIKVVKIFKKEIRSRLAEMIEWDLTSTK